MLLLATQFYILQVISDSKLQKALFHYIPKQNLVMGIGHSGRIDALITAVWGKYASSAEITCFLLSKNATLSVPEHTHHMNRQVKRNVSVQYRNNLTE